MDFWGGTWTGLKEWASIRLVETDCATHQLSHLYKLFGIPIKSLLILKLTTVCFLRAYVLLGSNNNLSISIKLHSVIIMVLEEAAFSFCCAF